MARSKKRIDLSCFKTSCIEAGLSAGFLASICRINLETLVVALRLSESIEGGVAEICLLRRSLELPAENGGLPARSSKITQPSE